MFGREEVVKVQDGGAVVVGGNIVAGGVVFFIGVTGLEGEGANSIRGSAGDVASVFI